MPQEMRAYLKHYGRNFNKKAFEFAVSHMKKDDGSGRLVKIQPYSKEEVDSLLKTYGYELKHDVLYNSAFVANMCKADNLGGSVPDEMHLAMYVREVVDDPDAADGEIFTKWYASMVRRGEPIDWEDLL